MEISMEQIRSILRIHDLYVNRNHKGSSVVEVHKAGINNGESVHKAGLNNGESVHKAGINNGESFINNSLYLLQQKDEDNDDSL